MPCCSSAVATSATCASRLRCASRLLASTPHNSRETTSGKRNARTLVMTRPDRMATANSSSEREDAAPAPRLERERRRIPRLVAPCYEPADPGHGMADETIDGVRISDDRFGRDGNEGEVGEHGRCAYHGAGGIGTGRAWRRPGRDPAAISRCTPALDRSLDRHQSRRLSRARPASGDLVAPADARGRAGAARRRRTPLRRPRSRDDRRRTRHPGADPAPAAPGADVAGRRRRADLCRA